LLVASENNGTRLYGFDASGRILPSPLAQCQDLAPDCHTPVLVEGKIFGCWKDLYCLDAGSLKPLWKTVDEAFDEYTSIIADRERLLITTARGELLLVGANGDRYQCLSRIRLGAGHIDFHSHPALVGNRLYVRSGTEVQCLALDP
jgi:outer membrane protein assembly factor BamB